MLSQDIQVGDVVVTTNDIVLIAVAIDASRTAPVKLLDSSYEPTWRTMRGTSSVYDNVVAIIGRVDSVPLKEDWPTAGEKFSIDGEYKLLDDRQMFVMAAGNDYVFFDRSGWKWTLTTEQMKNTRFRLRIRSLQDSVLPMF